MEVAIAVKALDALREIASMAIPDMIRCCSSIVRVRLREGTFGEVFLRLRLDVVHQ